MPKKKKKMKVERGLLDDGATVVDGVAGCGVAVTLDEEEERWSLRVVLPLFPLLLSFFLCFPFLFFFSFFYYSSFLSILFCLFFFLLLKTLLLFFSFPQPSLQVFLSLNTYLFYLCLSLSLSPFFFRFFLLIWPVKRGNYRTEEAGATLPLSIHGDKIGWLGRPLCSCLNRPQGMASLSNLHHGGR